MLAVAGVAIGNSCSVLERGEKHPPIIYGALVDLSGRGKTPIMKSVLKPIVAKEIEYRQEHAQALRDHKTKQEKEDTGELAPRGKEIILGDFTVEAVYQVQNNSPRGVIVFRDELSAWLNSMNAYRGKGSDEQFWMENWNGGIVKVNRSSSLRALFVQNSFCGVIGGTQHKVLLKFGQGDKGHNGFLARLLFSYPQESKSAAYNSKKPDFKHAENWQRIINFLFLLPMDMVPPEDEFSDWKINPNYISLSKTAIDMYQLFFNDISKQANENTDDDIKNAILEKHKTHVLRISLILHWLELASDFVESDDRPEVQEWSSLSTEDVQQMKISGETMGKAIEICKYFVHTSLKVVGKLGSPVEQLADNVRIWYTEGLPEEFTTDEAKTLGMAANISGRSVQRYLNNEKCALFKKVRRGTYEKLYA
jgi:hypothetical protein